MKATKCSLQPCLKKFKIKCLSSPSLEEDDMNAEMELGELEVSLPTSNQDSALVAKKMESIQLTPPTNIQNANSVQSSRKPVLRNKVSLKPGRSLMDWIRLGTSGKDLTGVGGRYLEVSNEELQKHNQANDAWLCIKGRVYNVTDYLEFHPGGPEELAKGFGKDATKLFLDAHSWVNYESLLQKCVVGSFVPFLVPPLMEKESPSQKREKKRLQYLEENPQITKTSSMHYDWYQSNESVVVVIYTNVPEITEEQIILDLLDKKEMLLTFYLKAVISYIHLDLSRPVKADTKVNIRANGKVEIVLPKAKPTIWESLGSHLSLHNCKKPLDEAELCYRPCKLVSRRCVTRNTYLLTLELSDGSKMRVPVARHISLKLRTNEMETNRSYTPIPKALLNREENLKSLGKRLYFMIKIYSDGALTPFIHKLAIGETIDVSDHFGTFAVSSIMNCDRLTLLAAGTGVTPMISILNHVLDDDSRAIDVHMLFFNRTGADILWQEHFDALEAKDKRFSITYVLSKPNPDWNGGKGHVSADLLQTVLNNEQKTKNFFCICGPTPFNRDCVRFLEELGHNVEKQVHVFPNN